jgi:hypothetical protein
MKELRDLAREYGVDPTIDVEIDEDTGATTYRPSALTALIEYVLRRRLFEQWLRHIHRPIKTWSGIRLD